MVGLADLKRHTDIIKKCELNVNNKYCHFYLTGLTTYEFLDILNYKSWIYKTYQKTVTVRYVNMIKRLEKGKAIFRTSVGFAPLLIRYLRGLGFQFRDVDIEPFRARSVVFPDLKIGLYDFQERMIHDWLNVGGIGVLKSPTGSGKTIVGCSAIKNIGRKALILVHTSDLLVNVWNDSLIKSFGPGIMGHVGIIGGGLSDSERMDLKVGARSNDFEENMKKDIVIGTFQTFNNRLDKLSQYKFGLMIVDECHHVPSTMFRKVNSAIKAPFKMGLSATTKRLDGMEKDCFGQLGDIQSSVSIRELINKGILAEPRFQSPIIIDDKVISQIENCGQSGLMFSQFVKKSSAGSEKKKNYIVNVCKSVAEGNRKFLLFTDYVNKEDVFVRDIYAESLLNEGVRVGIIDQGMGSDERSAVFKFLESGDISGIVFGKLGSEGVNIPSVDVVVMANAIKCVSGDTLIPTDKGIIRAEKLKDIKPRLVSTMDIKDRSIVVADINELYNFDQENTIIIMTRNGYEIEGSLTHLVMTIDKSGNYIFKSISDIRYGDELLICGSNLYGDDVKLDYKFIPDNDLDKYVLEIIDRIKSDGIVDNICKYKHVKLNFKELKNKFSHRLKISPQKLQEKIRYRFNKKGVSVSRPKYDEINDTYYYTFDLTYSGTFTVYEFKEDIFIPEYVNEDLAELLGYIVSEGYICSADRTVEIVNKSDKMVDRIVYLFDSIFGYNAHTKFLEKRNIDRIRCHSTKINGFLKYLDVEHRSGFKRIPWCILRSSKRIQLVFLKALFGGDGGITKRNNIVYGSKSKRLCDELHIMLLNMGIISKKEFNGLGWLITITSKEADKFIKDIGFFDDRKFEKDIVRHDHKRLSVSHYLDGCVVFIDDVVGKVKSKNKLYDMNIDKYHSFIGGGFINHNSPITFTQRVGRVMRKIPGKNFADVFEILLDIPTEYKWSEYNFAEYRAEGFTKLSYKVE